MAEVARRADARVNVDSHPGLGSTFTVAFPPTEASVEAPMRPGARAAPEGRLALLLVDDDEGVRRRVAAALEAAGHDVVQARDAQDAEQALAGRGQPVDAIVCDVVLPGASGPDLVRQLRGRGVVAPVLFISGYSREQVDLFAGGLGPGALLQKPFGPAELLARLAELFPPGGRPAE